MKNAHGRLADAHADSLRDTLHASEAERPAPAIGTLPTISPLAATMAMASPGDRSIATSPTVSPLAATMASAPALPGPAIDRIESDQIKGAIMEQLFGVRAGATRIGRFAVIGRLGEGGMGTVYAAYDEQLDRRVAVKVLRSDLGGRNAGARLRLVREAQAMARVTHPNLITVHEAGEHDGQVYVAMEFVRGLSLDAWLAARPGWRAVVDVFLAAGAGIAAAHRAGLIHRDFKPHNVMRADDGAVKVLDFGLARAVGAEEPLAGAESTALVDARLTRTGAVMGTPAYMPPEQHLGAAVDARSDQFSFCAALYEGLYGQLPFAGDTLVDLVKNIAAGAVRPPPADPAVPAWVARVVLRGLATDPDARFPTMEALLGELARDPARRRRRALSLAALAVTMASAGFAAASLAAGPAEAPCSGAAEALEDVWNPARRGALEAAFTAADPLAGAATWQRIAPRLDAHADAWATMRVDACEAHRGGEQSGNLLDLRMACLDRRLAGLDALAAAFAAADPDVVLNAVTAVDGLAPIHGCADQEALTAAIPPPEDPEARRRVRAEERALEEVAAHQLTGHYQAALAGVDAIDARARALDYPPLTAELALARGRAAQELQRGDEADAALTQALTIGLRARAEAIAAEAAARRIFVGSELLGQPKVALAAAPIADALIARAGEPPLLRWLWANNVAAALDTAESFADARAHYERAAAIARDHELPTQAAITAFNLGLLLAERGDHLGAAHGFAAAADGLERHLGPEHPQALAARVLALRADLELGHVAAARRDLDRVVVPLAARLGDDAPDVQMARLFAAEIALLQRRHDAARDLAAPIAAAATAPAPASAAEALLGAALLGLGQRDEALRHARAALDRAGDDAGWRLVRLAALGDTLRDAGALDEALARHREAVDAALAALGEGAPEVAILRTRLARTHLARGEHDAADRELTRALAAFEAAQPGSPEHARALALAGALALAEGRPADAVAPLRAALDRHATFDDDHPELNALRFDLARALAPDAAPTDEPLRLARAAALAYQRLGTPFAPEAAAVAAWLERAAPGG